mmetsp:Transcript_39063/g.110648  ORF Transcript_39063/g.110648 Transcript_39063/m.110648 type:complete len:203 (+) Transcript_39063:2983-3591(+)
MEYPHDGSVVLPHNLKSCKVQSHTGPRAAGHLKQGGHHPLGVEGIAAEKHPLAALEVLLLDVFWAQADGVGKAGAHGALVVMRKDHAAGRASLLGGDGVDPDLSPSHVALEHHTPLVVAPHSHDIAADTKSGCQTAAHVGNAAAWLADELADIGQHGADVFTAAAGAAANVALNEGIDLLVGDLADMINDCVGLDGDHHWRI